MQESDKIIETVLVENLEHHKSHTPFNVVWDDHNRRTGKAVRVKKSILVCVIAFLSAMVIFTGGYTAAKVFNKPARTDPVDYPFVQDEAVIGKWEVVDFVGKVEYFNAKNEDPEAESFLNALAFLPDGSMLLSIKGSPLTYSELIWTKDMVISKKNQTASKYMLQEIDGTLYMFYEWKSGDYIFRNLKPSYYVLKQADTKDYSASSPPRREDSTDYAFEEDPLILGEWKTVDYVNKIAQFNPQKPNDDSINYLIGLIIEENGKLTHTTLSGSLSNEDITWTKGLILNKSDKTAARYEIMELDGDLYLFYEWKSGDYIFRNMEPSYYVMKKTDR